jgi:TIR domain
MSDPLIFISYTHQAPWTEIADALALKLDVAGYSLIFDKDLVASDEWEEKLLGRLPEATHFVCLLCDAYWASPWCKQELLTIWQRYETAMRENKAAKKDKLPVPRLLFVKAGEINPGRLKFDRLRGRGELAFEDEPRLTNVADLQFLGPFDQHRRLAILDWGDKQKLDNQLGQLRDDFERTLGRSPE